MLWRFLERCGAQGVTFIVSLVLARLLDPAIYGTIAIVLVFTSILDVFVDSGLGNALIQKKDADDLDFSSVFFFNVCMCVVLYALIFLAAPLIASFYKKPELIALIRVMSLTVSYQESRTYSTHTYRATCCSSASFTPRLEARSALPLSVSIWHMRDTVSGRSSRSIF